MLLSCGGAVTVLVSFFFLSQLTRAEEDDDDYDSFDDDDDDDALDDDDDDDDDLEVDIRMPVGLPRDKAIEKINIDPPPSNLNGCLCRTSSVATG